MKKLVVLLAMSALSVSVFAMSKTPADSSACGADKACVKDAATCCTTDGSCKMTKDAAACAEKTACGTQKAVEDKAAGCAGGVCPLAK